MGDRRVVVDRQTPQIDGQGSDRIQRFVRQIGLGQIQFLHVPAMAVQVGQQRQHFRHADGVGTVVQRDLFQHFAPGQMPHRLCVQTRAIVQADFLQHDQSVQHGQSVALNGRGGKIERQHVARGVATQCGGKIERGVQCWVVVAAPLQPLWLPPLLFRFVAMQVPITEVHGLQRCAVRAQQDQRQRRAIVQHMRRQSFPQAKGIGVVVRGGGGGGGGVLHTLLRLSEIL